MPILDIVIGPEGPQGPTGPSGASVSVFGLTGVAGTFYMVPNAAVGGSGVPNVGDEVAVPFIVSVTTTIKTVSINVDTAAIGGSGAQLLVGIRQDNNGLPGTLLETTPAFDLYNAGVATVSLASSLTLNPGVYWLTYVYQYTSVPTTTPAVNQIGNALTGPVLVASAAAGLSNTTYYGYYQTGVSGALPSTFTNAGPAYSPNIPIQAVFGT